MKKIVSLLAIGALSVGFAEDDAKDYYLTGKLLTSGNDTISTDALNAQSEDLKKLQDFFEKVNNDPAEYLFKNYGYETYAEAFEDDYVWLNEDTCDELNKILTDEILDNILFSIYDTETDISDVIEIDYDGDGYCGTDLRGIGI